MNSELNNVERGELLRLLQEARDQAQRMYEKNVLVSGVENDVAKFSSLTIDLLSQRINAIANGGIHIRRHGSATPTGMGLWRGVSEWCDDDALLDAVDNVEKYYRGLQE